MVPGSELAKMSNLQVIKKSCFLAYDTKETLIKEFIKVIYKQATATP